MTETAALIARNAQRWINAKLTRGTEFKPVAQRLVAAKAHYQTVEARTGVPWFVVAVIHQRESSQNWSRSLAQGDPWNAVSTHVPKGRGPFDSWEAAAIDALAVCPPYAAKWKDWSAGGTMTLLEMYNGLGYASGPVTKDASGKIIARYPAQASPYIWSGTDQYTKGKYIADHHFDPNAVDAQLGCAGLILAMMALDPSIRLGAKPAPQPQPAPPKPKPAPQPVPTPQPQPVPLPAPHATGIAATIAAGAAAVAKWGHDHPAPVFIAVLAALGLVAAIILHARSKKG